MGIRRPSGLNTRSFLLKIACRSAVFSESFPHKTDVGVLVAKVLGVKTNIGIRLIIALIIIIYWPGNWVKYSGKVLENHWKKCVGTLIDA